MGIVTRHFFSKNPGSYHKRGKTKNQHMASLNWQIKSCVSQVEGMPLGIYSNSEVPSCEKELQKKSLLDYWILSGGYLTKECKLAAIMRHQKFSPKIPSIDWLFCMLFQVLIDGEILQETPKFDCQIHGFLEIFPTTNPMICESYIIVPLRPETVLTLGRCRIWRKSQEVLLLLLSNADTASGWTNTIRSNQWLKAASSSFTASWQFRSLYELRWW